MRFRLTSMTFGSQERCIDPEHLWHAPSVILFLRNFPRCMDGSPGSIKLPKAEIILRENREIVGHSCQMTRGVELHDGFLYALNCFGRIIAVSSCQCSAVEHGDRPADGETVSQRQVIEHFRMAATLLVMSCPIVNGANVGDGIHYRYVMLSSERILHSRF